MRRGGDHEHKYQNNLKTCICHQMLQIEKKKTQKVISTEKRMKNVGLYQA